MVTSPIFGNSILLLSLFYFSGTPDTANWGVCPLPHIAPQPKFLKKLGEYKIPKKAWLSEASFIDFSELREI